MKPWRQIGRIGIGVDFGGASVRREIGEAAIAEGRTYLQFNPDLIRRNVNPSPIRLRLDGSLQLGVKDLEGLPGLLHDSLPDGWARLVLDRAIRQSGYDHTSLTAIDRLTLVGSHGSGALVYEGDVVEDLKTPLVDFDTAAALVSGAPDEEDADLVRNALVLTGSLGGARPKANVWRSDGGFATIGGAGASPWLVKFPARTDGPESGALEYAYSLMAKDAGIDMPDAALLPSANTAGYFAVKRFDRTEDGGRLHMHSFGGLLNASTANSALGYRELMMVTGSLMQPAGLDVPAIEQQIARMAFNVLARNRDDHVKNHAFLMTETGEWALAPAYDLTYSNLQEHALLVGTSGREPGVADMLVVSRSVRIPDERTFEILARVRQAVAAWPIHARQANVSASLIRDVGASINPATKRARSAGLAAIARGDGLQPG